MRGATFLATPTKAEPTVLARYLSYIVTRVANGTKRSFTTSPAALTVLVPRLRWFLIPQRMCMVLRPVGGSCLPPARYWWAAALFSNSHHDPGGSGPRPRFIPLAELPTGGFRWLVWLWARTEFCTGRRTQ